MGAGGNRNKWPRRVKKKKNNKGAHSFQWAQEQQISPELAKQWVKLAVLAQEAEDLAQQRSCEEEELAKTQVWDHLIDVLEMAYPLALDCVNLINSYLPPSHQLDFIPPEEEAWTKEEFVQKFEDLMSFTYLARHLPDAAPAAVPQTLDDIRGDEDPRMEVDITLCDLYMYSSIGPRFPQGYDLEAVSSRVEHLAGEYPVRGEFEVLQYGYTAQYTPSSWDGIRNFVADRYTDFTNNIYVKSIFHKHGSRTEKVPLCYKGPVGPLLVLVHNFESTIPIKFTAMRALFNCLHDLRGKATRAIESLLTFNMQADELELYTLALCANEASDDPDAVRHETAMDKKVKMIISNIAASQALASGSSKAAVLPAEQAAGHSPLDEKQAPTAPIVVAQPVTKKRGQQDVLHLQPLPDVSMNAEKGVYTLDENILYSAGGAELDVCDVPENRVQAGEQPDHVCFAQHLLEPVG